MNAHSTRFDRIVPNIPPYACGISVVLSLVVLAGWMMDPGLLVMLSPVGFTMNPLAAVLISVTSVALWTQGGSPTWWRSLVAVLTGLLLVVAGAGLAETWLGFQAGLQWFTPRVGQAFLLLGISLLLAAIHVPRLLYPAHAVALALMALAFQGMVDSYYRLFVLHSAEAGTGSMPALTTLCFFLLAGAILFRQPRKGLTGVITHKGPGGSLLRVMVPLVLVVPNTLIFLAVQSVQDNHYDGSMVVMYGSLLMIGLIMALFFLVSAFLNRKSADLARSEQRFRDVANAAGEYLWEMDRDGRYVFLSERVQDVLGYPPSELVGRAFFEFIPAEEAETTKAFFQRAIASQKTFTNFVHSSLTRSGKLIWQSVNGVPLFDETGELTGFRGAALDITARKETEAALYRSMQTERALLDATSESAILVDTQGVVLAINQTGARRFKRTPEELVGRNIYDYMPADVAERRKVFLDECSNTGRPVRFEDEREGIFFETAVFPLIGEDGRTNGLAIYATNVTQRVKLQAVETLFHEIDQQVLRGQALPDLLKYVCAEVVRLFGYQFVWVGHKEDGGEISIAAWAGTVAGYHDELIKIGVRWDDTPQGHGPAGLTIRLGQPQIFKFSDPGFVPWRAAAERFDLRAILSIPLIIRGEIYGAFILYTQHEEDFKDAVTVQHMESIAGRICIALEMAMDQQKLRLLGTALSSAGNSIFIVDRRGHIQWLNEAFSRLTGYAAEEVLGENPRFLKSGKQDATYYRHLWATILKGEVWNNETIDRRKDGSLFTVRQTITPIRGTSGEISHFITILEDITAQKEAEARIEHMAHYDTLTDLPNRALFYDRLQQVLAQAKRGTHIAALMYLDLDRFKTVNDTLGHHVGDLLLQEVANRVRACVRETDTVARLGGDEFAVLLPEVENQASTAIVAQKIIMAFAEPFVLDGHELHSSTSIGIAFYPADAGEGEALLRCADNAMYQAKQKGRNNYYFFDAALHEPQ